MMPNPTINISASEARKLIGKGVPLTDFSITGILEIEAGSDWEKEISDKTKKY